MPLTFLSGYLGAGKTTLLNALLARTDRPIAVLVNDVGEINVDARLVKKRHGDTIELTDGCVCCSLTDGFGAAVDQIRAREVPPDHVVVELSGLADPERMRPWGRSAGFVLDGIVCAVDADHFLQRLEEPVVGHAQRSQLAAADVAVLTKTDLLTTRAVAEVQAKVRELEPGLLVEIGTSESIAGLLELGGRRPGGVTATPSVSLFDQHVVSTVPMPDPVTEDDIHRLLDELGCATQSTASKSSDVVRVKGVLPAADGGRWLVQVVGRRRSITPLPRSEWELPTPLVVIRRR